MTEQRTDTERLDWLEKNGVDLERGPSSWLWRCTSIDPKSPVNWLDMKYEHVNARAAIDAAIDLTEGARPGAEE